MKKQSKKKRADLALFEALNLESISMASALIMEGRALCNDARITGPGEMVPVGARFRIKGALDPYVSRGAHKLRKALDVFGIDLSGRNCVDIGASTGGFTDVMLRSGAARVFSVDVGYNLLDYRLRSDPRVTVLERHNARFLTSDDFDTTIDFGATDVSFISLKAILPVVLTLLGGRREFVALIKPQFEAQKELVGEKGVVRDPAVHMQVLKDILGFVDTLPWCAAGLDYSPIQGPEGNIEFLLYLKPRESQSVEIKSELLNDIVWAAYDNFSKSAESVL